MAGRLGRHVFVMAHFSLSLLILVAVLFVAGDVLGRELVPSEDQSRILVHVICPVGSSIKHVSDLLAQCEQKLVEKPEVQSVELVKLPPTGAPLPWLFSTK